MHDHNNNKVIPAAYVLLFFLLSGCGGGAATGAETGTGQAPSTDNITPTTASPSPGPSSTTSPTTTLPKTPGTGITSIQVQSQGSAEQSNVALTFGQVFKPGDVAAGAALMARDSSGAEVPLQVDSKATHADGSLRHAVLSTILPSLASGQTQALSLEINPASLPADTLSAAALLATGFDSQVQLTLAGVVYTASARTLLQANSSNLWLNGPLAKEWLLSGPVKMADGTPHPHLQARFAIRAYQGLQRARVDVTVENNWTYQPNPQNFTYDVTVTVGGTPVYSKAALTHYRQARWRKVFWWGAEPKAHVKHHAAYLKATKAIPNYDPAIVVPEATLAAMATNWNALSSTGPMGIAMLESDMEVPGGRPDIGPLPRWTARYLVSMDARAKLQTLGTGDLAGSWPMHFRDKTTDQPILLDTYPYFSQLESWQNTYNSAAGRYESLPACAVGASCAAPYKPDSAHQPSLAYAPYLVTGDYYYLEELLFWANWNIIRSAPSSREYKQGLVKWEEVRGQAWSMRTLGQAAYITPDSHPLKSYLTTKVNNNLVWYHNQYANNSSANLLGFIANGYAFVDSSSSTSGLNLLRPWQDDFFTWSMGYLTDLGFDKASSMLLWKSKFPVGRMTTPGYCWLNAANYDLKLRDTGGSAFYTTFSQAWLGTFGWMANNGVSYVSLPCNSQSQIDWLTAFYTARSEFYENPPWKINKMAGHPEDAESYTANLQAALAAAVDAGAPGASDAWSKFLSRSVKPDYHNAPQFAVVPRN